MYIDFEIVPLEEACEASYEWEFENYDETDESIEELETNIALAELFEEILGLEA